VYMALDDLLASFHPENSDKSALEFEKILSKNKILKSYISRLN
jgi:hypothetical protein